MKVLATIALTIAAIAAAPACRAATLAANSADAQLSVNGSGVAAFDTTNYQSRVGEYFYPGHAEYVVPFLLPTLSAGQGFTAASLRFQLFDKGGTPADVDLYGLGVRSSATVLASDDYVGTNDTANTRLQVSIVNATTPKRVDPNNGFVTTSTDGGTALANFLNTAYANGANAGKYVFLRLSPEAVSNGNNYYSVLTQDAGGSNEKPIINYTVGLVPEPASIAALGLVGLVGLRRRR